MPPGGRRAPHVRRSAALDRTRGAPSGSQGETHPWRIGGLTPVETCHVVLHELAPGCGHGKEWRYAARQVGLLRPRARPDVGELAGRPSRRPSSRRCPDSRAGRIRYPSTLEVRRARRRRPGARRRADSGPVTGGRTCHRDGCRHYQPGTETSVPIPKPQLAAADSGGVRGEQPVERGVGGPYGDGAGTARRGRDRLHRGGCRGSEACRCPGGKICEEVSVRVKPTTLTGLPSPVAPDGEGHRRRSRARPATAPAPARTRRQATGPSSQ